MKEEDLQNAVEFQKRAYGLLLWLKRRARTNPDLLSAGLAESLAHGDKCADWIRQQAGNFPCELRPPAGKVRALGFLLSSFFSTSFRFATVRQWRADDFEATLVAGAIEFRGRRHKRHAGLRQQQAAEELIRLALVSLAEESGVKIPGERLEQMLSNPALAADLALWAYGCELVRRCAYASQGPGVHRLWLALDERTRKNLLAEGIWQARERLMQWLKSAATVS